MFSYLCQVMKLYMETVLYQYHFNYLSSLTLLIPLIVGFGFFFFWKWYPAQNPGVTEKGTQEHTTYVVGKYIGWIVGAMAIILGIVLISNSVIDHQRVKHLLKSDNVNCVEGYTENYHAMPREGHDTEHFEINGVKFEYSNFEIVNGYNRPAVYGGVVTKNGQYLKIKYITDEFGNNTILYISELNS